MSTPPQNTDAPRVAFPEGSRGLNALQVFVVFALVLGAVLFGLREIDLLAGSVAEVDRMYHHAAADGGQLDELPVAKAAGVLPGLSDAARARLDAAGEPVVLHDKLIVEDRTLDGVLLVPAGARVVLRDVVVNGVIAAASALDRGPAGPSWVILEGSVRLDPGALLPGLAVALPGGSLLAPEADSAVQVVGDVLAERVQIQGAGGLAGRLHTRHPAVLSERVSRAPDGAAPALPAARPDHSALTSFEFP